MKYVLLATCLVMGLAFAAQAQSCKPATLNSQTAKEYDLIVFGPTSINEQDILVASMGKRRPVKILAQKAWHGIERGKVATIWFEGNPPFKDGDDALIYANKDGDRYIYEQCNGFTKPAGEAAQMKLLDGIFR